MFRALAVTILALSVLTPLAGAGEPTIPADPIVGDDIVGEPDGGIGPEARGLNDPLDLIPDTARFRRYSIGVDRWEVWACNTDDAAHLTVSDLQDTVDNYNTNVAEWFDWASGGRYRPEFSVGGLSHGGPTATGRFQCDADIQTQSRTRTDVHGALVVSNHAYGSGGVSDPGTAFFDAFPDNRRFMWLDYAQSWSFFFGFLQVHEMGHTIGWPHSGGEIPFEAGFDRGNPTDVMGCCPISAGAMGTNVLNRYAAGWIPKAKVKVLDGPRRRTFTIGPVGSDSVQMIVIPSGQDHRYTVLGVRSWDESGHDTMASLMSQGVEVYELDQTDFLFQGVPQTRWSLGRRTRPVPSPDFVDTDNDGQPDSWIAPHIFGVGDVFKIANRKIEVLFQTEDGAYRVRISKARRCGGEVPTLIGSSVDDALVGTGGRDVIAGLDGADTIEGLGGGDLLCGNEARDLIIGGPGPDWMYGAKGNDRLKGDGGDDHAFGGSGNDRLAGHRGKDVLDGGKGTDRGIGGAGPDSCISIEIEKSC
jgi:hypothetical protein